MTHDKAKAKDKTPSNLSPHDRYVRAVLESKQASLEFFQLYLPQEILKITDLNSLQLQKNSFIDEELKMKVTDLLFSATINGKKGFLYLLIEHASSPQKLLPFRMLKYMFAILEDHLQKNKSSELPFIYPTILYTGHKPYPYSTDLFDLFGDHKELARKTLLAPCPLVDLTQVSDQDLKTYLEFGTMAFITKHVHDEDVLLAFQEMINLLKKLEQRGMRSYIKMSLSYIVQTAHISDKEQFVHKLKQLDSIDEDEFMTIVELFKPEILQRGIQQGKIEGKIEASHEIALKMLRRGLSLEEISEDTDLSLEDLQEIKKTLH